MTLSTYNLQREGFPVEAPPSQAPPSESNDVPSLVQSGRRGASPPRSLAFPRSPRLACPSWYMPWIVDSCSGHVLPGRLVFSGSSLRVSAFPPLSSGPATRSEHPWGIAEVTAIQAKYTKALSKNTGKDSDEKYNTGNSLSLLMAYHKVKYALAQTVRTLPERGQMDSELCTILEAAGKIRADAEERFTKTRDHVFDWPCWWTCTFILLLEERIIEIHQNHVRKYEIHKAEVVESESLMRVSGIELIEGTEGEPYRMDINLKSAYDESVLRFSREPKTMAGSIFQ